MKREYRLLMSVLLVSVVVLPFDFQPLRFERHEPHRAGLLLILVLFALPAMVRRLLRANPLVFALAIWCSVLIVSALFALSPTRAVFGDLIRRMGLLTQLALVGGVLLGVWIPAQSWRWFWWAGVGVAAYVCLQSAGIIPNLYGPRPPGPFGVATYTGGWLVQAGLWAALGMMAAPCDLTQPLRKKIFALGLALMFLALILTESRGAILSLMAGGLTASLLWAAAHASRRLAIGVVCLVILVGGAAMIVSRADWQGTFLSDLPFISRLSPDALDLPRKSREITWTNALAIVREWPVLTNIDGEVDQWHELRPVVGYGQETFEILHRPLMTSDSIIDRAHNDWLDTLLTSGWAGVIARLVLWMSAWWIGLRRMGFKPHSLLLGMGACPIIGGLLTWNSPYLPIGLTIGTLTGSWLYLLWQVLRSKPTSNVSDWKAWLALSILSAHVVDLQFSFETIATAWPAWLAFGLLLVPPQQQTNSHFDSNAIWVCVSLAGALIIRSILAVSWLGCMVLLVVLVMLAWAIASLPRRAWRWIITFWFMGVLAALPQSPEIAALWDSALIFAALWLMVGGRIESAIRPTTLVWAAIVLLVLGLWVRDILADIYLSRAMNLSGEAAADEIRPAVNLRPWDDRLWSAAGNLALQGSVNAPESPDTVWLEIARGDLERASQLNGYDASTAYLLAVMETQYTLIAASDWDSHLERADGYFDAATRLWPTQAYFWREWARFSWELRGDTDAAYIQIQQALRLDSDNQPTSLLLAEIEVAR
jgi:hypothetical protein